VGDLSVAAYEPVWQQDGAVQALFGSCSLAFLMTFVMFRCTILTSPTTTSITGHVKNYVMLVVGFFVLGGVPYHPLNLFGHAVTAFGSGLYFYALFVAPAPSVST
jgi:hypothetical protein